MFGFGSMFGSGGASVQVTEPEELEDLVPIDYGLEKEFGQLEEYVALAQKVGAETSAVKSLRLEAFLAKRGMPVYYSEDVHLRLLSLAQGKGGMGYYDWHPLRAIDANTTFRWWWNDKCRSDPKVYHEQVPMSVLATVDTILAEFPDASFFVSDVPGVDDPFLLVTFPDVLGTIVDWWDEPGYVPTIKDVV